MEPEDIANAVGWLVSDAARYVTVDAGYLNQDAKGPHLIPEAVSRLRNGRGPGCV